MLGAVFIFAAGVGTGIGLGYGLWGEPNWVGVETTTSPPGPTVRGVSFSAAAGHPRFERGAGRGPPTRELHQW